MLAIPDEALLCDDLKTTPNSQSRHLEAVHRLSCAPRLGSGAIYSMKSNAIQTIPCIPEQDPTLCSSKSMKNPATLSPLLAGWTPVLTGNARLFYHVQCYCHPFPTARHERSLSVARRLLGHIFGLIRYSSWLPLGTHICPMPKLEHRHQIPANTCVVCRAGELLLPICQGSALRL
jgi:hypothetical protein